MIAAAVFFLFIPGSRNEQGGAVEIYQDGQLVRQYPLSQDTILELTGEYTNIITIQDGRAAITQSDCPGSDCVHSGWISSVGRSIVCLPNRTEVRITGAMDDVDFAVR